MRRENTGEASFDAAVNYYEFILPMFDNEIYRDDEQSLYRFIERGRHKQAIEMTAEIRVSASSRRYDARRHYQLVNARRVTHRASMSECLRGNEIPPLSTGKWYVARDMYEDASLRCHLGA